jgi:uncharacterized protein
MTERHHRIDYLELRARDLAEAKRFYGSAFGWRFVDYGPQYTGIEGEGKEQGGIEHVAGFQATRGGPLPILFSSALEQTMEAVTSSGGTIITAPFSFPGGRRFQFTDPSGNELAVWGA